MDQLTDREMDLAEVRGQDLAASQARAAYYDRATGRIVVELDNGCIYGFPARLVQDFQGVAESALEDVRVDGVGFNLQWPTLDVDLYVPALVSGTFGTLAWMTRAEAQPRKRA